MFDSMSFKAAGLVTAAVVGLGSAVQADAATITQGSATDNLNGSFFVDDAATGGSDSSTGGGNRNIGPRNWDMNFDGIIDASDVGTAGTITIQGIAFASNGNAAQNNATQATIGVIYLGADGALGGGDDVNLGNETFVKAYSGAGEYYGNFDTPLVAAIDGLNNKFIVTMSTNNTGSFVTKNATIPFDGFNGPKLSVSGNFVPVPEPSSLALLGLGGLLIARRRRG